jgi:hypothetical protein
MIFYSYIKEVLGRFKYLLGGGSVVVVTAGIFEHYIANSISWSSYTWILVGCFITALISQGVAQHRRLQTRIVIRNLERRVWPISQHNFTGAEYYFEIFNTSESEPLEDGRAELIDQKPDAIGYLPVPLHIKHDTYEQRDFSINPG